MSETTQRPWGSYTILEDTKAFKLKRIEVKPGARLSLQSHYKRDEIWTIVAGSGIVELDGKDIEVTYGTTVSITREQKHRVRNNGTEILVFIEVQTGDYFGEDDIVRYEDDYGREGTN